MIYAVLVLIVLPCAAFAHASEGGFVLLLPTQGYILAGTAAVAMTVLLVSVLPARLGTTLFRTWVIWPRAAVEHGALLDADPSENLWAAEDSGKSALRLAAGLMGVLCFAALLWIGVVGPRDPSENLLTLGIWTLFWIVFPVVHALFGNLWAVINPWQALAHLARRAGVGPVWTLSPALAQAVAILSFVAFSAVLMAHPAPTDPDSLAAMAASYWAFHMLGTLLLVLCGWPEPRGSVSSLPPMQLWRLSRARVGPGALVCRAGVWPMGTRRRLGQRCSVSPYWRLAVSTGSTRPFSGSVGLGSTRWSSPGARR